jgi:hypothetical protein
MLVFSSTYTLNLLQRKKTTNIGEPDSLFANPYIPQLWPLDHVLLSEYP